MTVTARSFAAWLQAYFDAWRTNDPNDVASLFAENARYEYGPFREPALGSEQIVENWVSNSNNPPDLQTSFSVVATAGRIGVAHWHAAFSSPPSALVELDGVLVIEFNEQGKCTHHREWYQQQQHVLAAPPSEA